MAKKSREKYIGFVGQNNWTEKSFVKVEYRQIAGFLYQYEKVLTIHLDFTSLEEHQAAWKKYRQEFEDGLYGDCNFVNDAIYSAFTSCLLKYNRHQSNPFQCNVESSQLGWVLDGWGRMRKI